MGQFSDETTNEQQYQATFLAMIGIAPRDEIEGMPPRSSWRPTTALWSATGAPCWASRPFEGSKEALNQANKLSRTYTTLLEALNRRRGKGQQKVTVEHVHVHAGGQAIVGAVEGGGGASAENQRQPDAEAPCHAPVAEMWSEDQEREPVPVSGEA